MAKNPTPCLTIRQAFPGDAVKISAVINACIDVTHGVNYSPRQIQVWKDGYTPTEILNQFNEKRWVFLLESAKHICGTIQFDPRCNQIKGFYVHPSHQNRGFGTILFLYVLGLLKDVGNQEVELSSNPFFKEYYERFAFKAIRSETVVWGGLRFKEYIMRKTLIHQYSHPVH